MKLNAEKKGVEIHFPSKPAAEVLGALKANGWRWSRFSACWYAKQSPEAIAFAQSIAGNPGAVVLAPAAAAQPAAQTRGEIIG